MLRVFESFSGYGSQSLALRYANIPHKVVGISEIDDVAIEAYKALHGTVKNYGDITKINVKELPDFDLFTYSFPCQSVSLCGKRKGFSEGTGTTSSLLWECKKIINEKKPTYLMMENVTGLLTGKKNKEDFEKWCNWLEVQGYTSYWKVLDARDFNVPQHRERVIMVSIKGKHISFNFPIGQGCKKSLNDILDNTVDLKYNLKEKYSGVIETLESKIEVKSDKIHRIGNISKTYGKGNAGGIYDSKGVSPTIIAGCGSGGNNVPHVAIFDDSSKPFVRKLTPVECLRLMGLKNKDIIKIKTKTAFSDTKLYHLAGNSIVVDVLVAIFNTLLNDIEKSKSA